MSLTRGYCKTTYTDGTVEVFDPLIRWMIYPKLWEIGLRGDYSIGLMWGWRIGSYTTYRTKWLQVGRLTVYLHLGKTEPHNPRLNREGR